MKRIAIFPGLIILSLQNLPAQTDDKFFLSGDSLRKYESLPITQNWKYHSGDDASWAKPEFDDRDWENAATILAPDNLPRSGWSGIGWFRLHLQVDSLLWNKPLALTMHQMGASEIYLDGQLLYRLGRVGVSKTEEDGEILDYQVDPKVILFDRRAEHLITVRYSNFSAEDVKHTKTPPGFSIVVGDLNRTIALRTHQARATTFFQALVSLAPLVLALLHLFIFLFHRRAKENLYFAASAGCTGALAFAIHQLVFSFTTTVSELVFFRKFWGASLLILLVTGIRFIYTLFYPTLPRPFWLFFIAGIGLGFWHLHDPTAAVRYLGLFTIVTFLEALRVVFLAIFRKREGAWILGVGFAIVFISGLMINLWVLGAIDYPDMINRILWLVITFGLLFCMSVYLARNFAMTNRNLETQLVQVKALSQRTLEQERRAQEQEMQRRLLEADNARKTRELEEARKLQLSMLPQTVPQLPHLEIAVYIKPATEVGGDYYDFLLAEDGTLTVAIGDATGHGAKAGTMVATTKGLFGVLAKEADMQNIFATFTKIIKSMNLGNLYMAMALVKIKDHRLLASSAGMPPLLIYHAATNQVEELELKGMPLGIFVEFPYQVKEMKLETGDTILLMSDGLPERFNPDGEILDYPAAKNIFAEVADKPPAEIIAHLNQAGEKWANGRTQEDDVTFVVMKVNQPARLEKA